MCEAESVTDRSWREIPCREVDWEICGVSRRAALKVRFACRVGKEDGGLAFNSGPWAHMTLGEIADMGVRAWRRSAENIGDLAQQVIMRTIDMAAEGKRVTYPKVAPDAYVPRCERETAA